MKNSDVKETIDHAGVVQKRGEKSVIVLIAASSACAGCIAGASCSLPGTEDKIIEVSGSYNVKPGDKVNVIMKQSMGYNALFLGYLLPLILIITILVVLISMKVSELAAGLTSVAILLPYYLILYLFRKQINQKFTFTLKV